MQEIFSALNIDNSLDIINPSTLPSCFAVSDLAAFSVGSVGCVISNLISDIGLVADEPAVQVDQRLASLWFAQSIYPLGWELPSAWDAVAGDYQTEDGWIKLHTNLAHHRKAALAVLNCEEDRDEVAKQVLKWKAATLETEIVAAGGVAAKLRSREEWQAHPQGMVVATEPLIAWSEPSQGQIRRRNASRARPLSGLRVLDLTRVLAGPVSTRTLAGFGAEVLRIDPPGWDEPFVVPDITLGKRCANLYLQDKSDRETFENLLSNADVLIHGYRPDALERLGYGESRRQELAPNLLEVSLDAYGWTGPWAQRRGFDSLVQMSCGIAHTGMQWANQTKPTSLPVQALDHATGYLMAAAAIKAITMASNSEGIRNAHLSLARTAELLMHYPQNTQAQFNQDAEQDDFSTKLESTPWGNANRLKSPVQIDGTPLSWELSASNLGTASAKWI